MDSNERLGDVFEMLVHQIGSVGDQLTAVQRQLDQQQACMRHADTLRPLEVPFSGMALCGEPVTFTMFAPFNEEGVFDVGEPYMGCLLIETNHALCNDLPAMKDGSTSEWESAARKAWGPSGYLNVIASLEAWKVHSPTDGRGPTSSELGIESSHRFIRNEIFEIQSLIKYPNLIALGVFGLLVETVDIKELHRMTKDLSRTCGVYRVRDMKIHYMETSHVPMAKACLCGVRGGGRAAWASLDHYDRAKIKKNSYFTKERMERALG